MFFRYIPPILRISLALLPSYTAWGGLAAQPAAMGTLGEQVGSAIIIDDIKINSSQLAGRESSITVDTKWYKVEIAAKGAEITTFLHRDTEYPLRDNVKITDPEPLPLQVYMNPASYKALEMSFFDLKKEENATEIIVTATVPVALSSGSRTFGAVLSKVFTFSKKHHFWRFTWKISHRAPEALRLNNLYFYPVANVGPKADEKSPRSAQTRYNFIHTDDDFNILYAGEGGSFLGCGGGAGENRVFQSKINFFGMSSRFMVVGIQPVSATAGLHYFVTDGNRQQFDPPQMHLQLAPLQIEKNGTGELSFIIYTGPKVGDYLSATSAYNADLPFKNQLHKDLYKGFDFGITAPIRDLIVMILELFYKVIPNYGIGIIIFALLFKLAFFQLNQKQADSMKKMAVLQPLMKEINEKYKDNPQEKNRRLMLLYKEHKVNPMSGCLPMLLQIPIFIALYSAFSDSYDLWKSPFIPGWVTDLSEPDTVFILPDTLPLAGGFAFHLLPILMTVTQFIQTKLTVFSGDENQKKIMQLMPFLMLVFFWSMPSGVVLYWTMQNILSIAQQLYTNMRDEKKT